MAEQHNVSYLLKEEVAWKMLAALYVADESMDAHLKLLRDMKAPNTSEFIKITLARFVVHDVLHSIMDMIGTDVLSDEEKARLRDIASRLKEDN